MKQAPTATRTNSTPGVLAAAAVVASVLLFALSASAGTPPVVPLHTPPQSDVARIVGTTSPEFGRDALPTPKAEVGRGHATGPGGDTRHAESGVLLAAPVGTPAFAVSARPYLVSDRRSTSRLPLHVLFCTWLV